MFSVEEVKTCPVTRMSSGVITITPEYIAMVAGAVRDNIEWIVLLNGTRSEDGYEVNVERFSVPEQTRSGAHADMKELDLDDDVVGVMHSHHTMGAFFSKTDEDELNPRFGSSIVVAVAENNLGFKYKAAGKVVLPCGSIGIVNFYLAVAGVEHFSNSPVRGMKQDELEVEDLLECPKWESVDDEYQRVYRAECGRVEYGEKPLVFGKAGGDRLLAAIREQTARPTFSFGFNNGNYGKSHGGSHVGYKNKKSAYNPNKQYGYNIGGNVGKAKVKGGCDWCSEQQMLTWILEHRLWLCKDCQKDLQKVKDDAAKEAALKREKKALASTDEGEIDYGYYYHGGY